jgi:hypothetical protein
VVEQRSVCEQAAIIVNIFWSPEFTGIMDKLRKRKTQEINSNKAIQ